MKYSITRTEFKQGQIRLQVSAQGSIEKVFLDGPKYVSNGLLMLEEHLHRGCSFDGNYIERLKNDGWKVQVVNEDMPTNLKIALWCRLWQEFKGEKWQMSGPDARKMGEMKVDEALLRWYLNDADMPQTAQTWLWRTKQSIGNLFHHLNGVRVAMTAPAASKHPNHWDANHLRTLDGPGIAEYHRHLKSRGLVPKHHRDGTILDYVQP